MASPATRPAQYRPSKGGPEADHAFEGGDLERAGARTEESCKSRCVRLWGKLEAYTLRAGAVSGARRRSSALTMLGGLPDPPRARLDQRVRPSLAALGHEPREAAPV